MANDDFWDVPEEVAYQEPEADPEEWTRRTNRWSYHLANDPYGGAAGEWAKQYYDNPNIDPNQVIGSQISAFRQQYGDAAPEDDISILQMIATGQRPQPKQQTSTEQWNKEPGAFPTVPEGPPIPGVPAAPGAPGGTSPTQESDRALLELLMSRAKQASAVGRDDPNVRAQVDPITAQMQRASRDYLDQLAEGTRGLPVNLAGEQRLAAERLGQQAGAMESEVIGREIGARRQEIADALAMWGDKLSTEQQISLQRELGYLSDKARAAERNTETDRFMRELALREWMARNQDYYTRAGL